MVTNFMEKHGGGAATTKKNIAYNNMCVHASRQKEIAVSCVGNIYINGTRRQE